MITKQKKGMFFRNTGLLFYDHRLKVIFIFIVLILLSLQSFSIEGYLKKDDSTLTNYPQFRKDFFYESTCNLLRYFNLCRGLRLAADLLCPPMAIIWRIIL
jgi:hypothetical protein